MEKFEKYFVVFEVDYLKEIVIFDNILKVLKEVEEMRKAGKKVLHIIRGFDIKEIAQEIQEKHDPPRS